MRDEGDWLNQTVRRSATGQTKITSWPSRDMLSKDGGDIGEVNNQSIVIQKVRVKRPIYINNPKGRVILTPSNGSLARVSLGETVCYVVVWEILQMHSALRHKDYKMWEI